VTALHGGKRLAIEVALPPPQARLFDHIAGDPEGSCDLKVDEQFELVGNGACETLYRLRAQGREAVTAARMVRPFFENMTRCSVALRG